MASRNVNANGAKRGKISEILVHNYPNIQKKRKNQALDFTPNYVEVKQLITDGEGWNKAKSKLAEAYEDIPRVYNFTTLPEFITEIKNNL